MAFGRWPRTDHGTVALHAVLLFSFLVLLATGLRIASDDPDCSWLAVFDPVLPVEHLWYRHVVAGVGMIAALAGYAAYVARARLGARMRFDSTRVAAIWRGGTPRFSALNVAVMWTLIGALLVEIVSGAMLFWGAGQVVVGVHLWATWLSVLCVIGHVALHAACGGVRQVLRIFLPSRLRLGKPPPDLADLLAEQLRRRSGPPSWDEGSPPSAGNDSATGTLHSHPL